MIRAKAWRAALVCLLGCAAATGCSGSQAPGSNSPANSSVGKAPDFSVELLKGDTFRLSDHLGKDVIVIDFWTTFCVPCIAVLRHLQEVQDKYKDRGLVVIGVSMDPPETAGQIGPFVNTHHLTFPIAHDVDSQVTNLYNKKTTAPYQVLIGRDGQILKRRETYQPGDETGMEADILAALGTR